MSSVSAPGQISAPTEGPVSGSRWVGWALALGSTVCFSVAAPIARVAIQNGLDPTALLVARMLLAILLLAGTIAVRDLAVFRVSGRCLGLTVGAGLVNALGMLGFFWALTRLEASMASMIVSLNPLVVLSLLALRGERFTYRHGVRVMLALFGVYLLVGPSGQADPVGVALVLVAVVSFAVQLVTIQWFLTGYDARSVTLYVLMGMTAGVVGMWFLQGAQWHDPGWQGWLAICVLALVSTYFARLLLFAGVSRIGGGQMALLTPLETFLTIVWSMLFLHERLTPVQWMGGTLILISAILAIRRLGRSRKKRMG